MGHSSDTRRARDRYRIVRDVVSGDLFSSAIWLGAPSLFPKNVRYVFRSAPVSDLLTAHGHDHIPDTQTFIKHDTVESA